MTLDLTAPADVGALVRHWRQRRRLSQQALSDQCGVSTRHLSYIETGKARPSPTMVGQLSEALSVPLRERRRLFTAAGFVPDASELPLDAPALAEVNEALEQILAGHEPYPALVVDGGWDLVTANDAAYRLLTGVPRLATLIADFPVPRPLPAPGIVLTLRLRAGDDELSFLTTTTVFGTPGDVTVAELAIEALYPADTAPRDLLGRID